MRCGTRKSCATYSGPPQERVAEDPEHYADVIRWATRLGHLFAGED
jgi:hypothetical protein